ncbi:MAG: hypothetical protein COX57_11410 [Alphaproteobacteria bacterium CG_4_10_14_0_2_um_filter_63_37]|nr:MAG: hypothetical protein AUJ55_03070 [Proteobacteria bacterium CG1_02_64_396]PJA23904.1 MAG: hypothetical protein COX57_11410 [Alphaproteobacteria bacterium CG_4_10_14_0_2_um_filter_63_37]
MMIKKIMLVEDSETTLQMVSYLLTQDGHEVLMARDGNEAMGILATERPDLIISDIMMPNMDGYAFYEAVRDQRRFSVTPFIFLSAREELPDRVDALLKGVDDYITKPIEPQEFIARIRTALRRSERFYSLYPLDPITQVAKYETFHERLKQEMERCVRFQRPFVIAGFGVDQIQTYKKMHGDWVVDFLMEKVAEFIKARVRKLDLLGRVGPEIFALILPETNEEDARIFFERLKVELGNINFMHPRLEKRLEASLNYSILTGCDAVKEAQTAEALIARSTQALQRRW